MAKQYLPKITVITIVKNDPEGFLITARSVLKQDYPKIEWVVVDGLSTDATSLYINNLLPCISALKIEVDTGIYNAMNKGIDMASGDWIFFMNAGDIFFKSTTVSEYVKRIKPDDEVIFSNVVRREDGKIHLYKDINKIWMGMSFDHQSILVRTKIYKALKYDESYKISGDNDFFSRAYQNGYKFRKLPFIIACKKPFNTGASSDFILRQGERIRVMKKYYADKPWKISLLKEYKYTFKSKKISRQEFINLNKLIEG